MDSLANLVEIYGSAIHPSLASSFPSRCPIIKFNTIISHFSEEKTTYNWFSSDMLETCNMSGIQHTEVPCSINFFKLLSMKTNRQILADQKK